jgi:hypothetical protein
MHPLTIIRIAVFVLFIATIAIAGDQTAPTYQQGTVMGWDTRLDSKTHGGFGNTPVRTDTRRTKVYELKGADLSYQIDDCGSFQSGKFTAGQAVDYRVDDKRLYIRREDGKEYKCKIEGTRVVEGPKADAPSAAH